MKKNLFTYICLAFIGILPAKAQHTLKFNTDKKFKIVQFTDLHYISGDSRSVVALENMKEVLAVEKPDFVIFTGDVIFGKPAGKSMREVLDVVSERKTPFAVTFGNHDDEHDLTR